MDAATLARLRELVRGSLVKEANTTALFWADKIASVSDDPNDLYTLARCYAKAGEPSRAYQLLKRSGLTDSSATCRHLAATCLIAQEEWSLCLEVLDSKTVSGTTSPDPIAPAEHAGVKIEALLAYLTGRVHHRLGNFDKARHFLKIAVSTDVYCYEALEILLEYHLLSAEDERLLMRSLDFARQCGPDADLVRALYTAKLKKFDQLEGLGASLEALRGRFGLGQNSDVVAAHAEALFYQCRFRQALQVTAGVIERDAFHHGSLLIHVACLYELEQKNDLFILSHQLVEGYPDRAIAWFAVGVYYFLVRRNAEARRHFIKATSLDANFGPGWLAFGHSFAADTETDPALSAYTTAARLLQGCHLPLLFIAMEHLKSNNPSAADGYFREALALYRHDPLLHNEVGVMHYRAGDYEKALAAFHEALALMEGHDHKKAALKASHVNVGHCHRKLRQFEQALDHYERALALDPHCASALAALGFVHQLQGASLEAIGYYHQALALRPGDGFATEMLSRALQEQFQRPLGLASVPPADISAKVAAFSSRRANAAAGGDAADADADDTDEEDGGGGGAHHDHGEDEDMMIE